MRLRPEQLAAALARKAPAPIYVVFGEEPLQVTEAVDAIRAAVRKAGADERVVLDVESGFDWRRLAEATGSLSLFASRRLIEVRLGDAKPGADGGAALAGYAERPAPDDVLLVTAGKLDSRAQQAAWFKACEQAGVAVQAWPVEAAEMPRWVAHRAAARELVLDADAAALIAERSEGNLLAAAQEIDKLSLAAAGGRLTTAEVRSIVNDSARYDAFDLVDAALAADASRVERILRGLAAEGVEPVMIGWALAREIGTLTGVAEALAAGAPQERALTEAGVWSSRRALVGAAVRRRRPPAWRRLLRLSGRLERVLKGAAPGEPWQELRWLALLLAGAPLAWVEEPLLR